MSIFEEFGITWNGEELVVPSDKVMGLVEVVEDIVTIEELHNKTGIKRAKMARAFASIINYAGGRATQEQVYNKFFEDGAQVQIQVIIERILFLMIPPEHLQSKSESKDSKKKEG